LWKLRTDVPDPRTFAFGFGRRVCPGTHIAEQSLFATLATVLHTLDVMRAKGPDGKEVIPDVKVNSGALCHPLPFPYELHMRKDARELVDICATDADK
jgi:cytochrome P450